MDNKFDQICRVYEKINGVMLMILAYTIVSNQSSTSNIAESITYIDPAFFSFYLVLLGFSNILHSTYNIRSIINLLSTSIWVTLAMSVYMKAGIGIELGMLMIMALASVYIYAYQAVLGQEK
jgi:hypothetical protein